MKVRLRRLYADHQHVLKVFDNHPHIKLLEAKGDPPERYIFEFLLNGLVEAGEDNVTAIETHKVEIYLPVDYPRRPPFCCNYPYVKMFFAAVKLATKTLRHIRAFVAKFSFVSGRGPRHHD